MGYSRQSVAYKNDISFDSNKIKTPIKLDVVESKPVTILGTAPIKVVFLMLIFITIASYLVYSRVVLAEITEKIYDYENQYNVLLSEQTRLEIESESKISLKNIEEKAKLMGLRPIQDYQVEYICFEEKDNIELTNQKSNFIKRNGKKFLDKILEYIK